MDGGPGSQDSVNYDRTTGVSVDLTDTIGAVQGATGEGDKIVGGVEDVFAGSGSDTLIGDAGANTLVGGDGFDVVVGGFGKDVVVGGDGDDLLSGNRLNLFVEPVVPNSDGAIDIVNGLDDNDICVKSEVDPDITTADCETVAVHN